MREHAWGTVRYNGGVIVFDFNAADVGGSADAYEMAVTTIHRELGTLGIGPDERAWKSQPTVSES
jgi:hypothetical protein